jgi:hypothetical protein
MIDLNAILAYDCEQILNKMVRNGGRATYLPVGWEPDK